jgi:PAS domain S-box-containing protein
MRTPHLNKPQTGQKPHTRTPFQHHDVRWFALLTVLGAAASYLSVNIPYTKAFIEGRWIFGYMGFALLRRWWVALLMACILSLAGFHKVSLEIAFLGNMLYAFPIFLVIRFVYPHMLARLRNMVWFGAGWLLLILLCYQAFTTPVVWGFMAFLEGNPIWPGMVQGWRDQPWLFESLLVGIISALGLMVVHVTADLRASQRELATTLYSIGDGVIATDTEGRIRRMNAVAEKLTGWTEADALGQSLDTVFRIIDEASRRPMQNPVKRVLAEGVVVGLSNRTVLMARDGTEYPIADSGAPIRDDNGDVSGVVLVFRDQTEERATQQQLEQQHERLLLALRNASMGIWDWDVTTNQVDWSDEHAVLFGMPLDQFGGTIDDVQRIVHPDDREQAMEIFRRTLETGTDFDSTYRIVRPDGSIRWLHSYGKLSCDEAGQPRRIVGTTRDITERKHAEEEIRTLNTTLERRVVERTTQLETMNAELKDFAYIVSHDLKAPLRGVSQLVTWLVRDYEDVVDDQGKDMFRLLKSRVQRMTHLIDGILKYSRIGHLDGEMQSLNLQDIVCDVIDSLTPPAHIDVTIASELPVIWGDYTRMTQVFQNVIGNAIQYNDKPRGHVAIRCEDNGEWWQVSVADNGPGIAEKDFDRVFKIFQTAHPHTEEGSTGVGLSVVKKIIEQSGGKVWIESKIGVGSTFFLTIPKDVKQHDEQKN